MSRGLQVSIEGNGVAASAAAAVLGRSGVAAHVPNGSRSDRVVVLSQTSIDILGDLFGERVVRLQQAPSVTRVVDWDGVAAPAVIDDGARTIALGDLVRMIGTSGSSVLLPEATSLLNIEALGRHANVGIVKTTQGLATASWPRLDPGILQMGSRTSLIRTTDAGWVFVAPRPDGHYFAQCTVLAGPHAPEQALDQLATVLGLPPARLAALGAGELLDTSPKLGRLASGSFPNVRIACGDQATAFDPLSGDGCGNALRSGVVAAAACLRLASRPAEANEILSWVRAHALERFIVHVQACADLYATARFADAWCGYVHELRAVARRLQHLRTADAQAYRLIDCRLEPLAS